MAYEKHEWQCGETITADKLNHIEDGIAEASGGGTAGYECTEERVTLAEESVTTAVDPEYPDDGAFGTLSYAEPITADMLKVTFNGAEYNCSAIAGEAGAVSYGAQYDAQSGGFDWSEYPFSINSYHGDNRISTETAGTHQVKIEVVQLSSEISECFKAAVQKASAPLVLDVNNNVLNRSFREIAQAYLSGRTVLLDPLGVSKDWYSMVSLSIDNIGSDVSGGSIIFGGVKAQTFTAKSASGYPARAASPE